MIRVFVHIIFLALIFLSVSSVAQTDSVKVLDEVTITTRAINEHSTGSVVRNVDSLVLKTSSFANISDVLAQQSMVYVKNYGVSNISSTSSRGGSASHTAFLWNGLNIQSPMLGSFDVSLLPSVLFKNYTFQQGSQSSMWGSGAVGASIHFNDNQTFNKGFVSNIGYSYGSFGNHQMFSNSSFSSKKLATTFTIYANNALNNFPIYTPDLQLLKVNSHAKVNQFGGKLDFAYKLKHNQILDIKLWKGSSTREIPPTIFQNTNDAVLQDEFLRTQLNWSLHKSSYNISLKNAFFQEKTIYSFLNKIDTSKSRTFLTQLEGDYTFSNSFKAYFGTNIQRNEAFSRNFEAVNAQTKVSTWHSLHKDFYQKKITIQYSGRQELMANTAIPYVPSVGANAYVFKEYIKIGGNIARSFRLPTLNDLYWTPGGNKNLLPESGWGQELNLQTNFEKNRFLFENKSSIFSKKLNNWIMWQPINGVWSPQNLMKVWSRGVETFSSVGYNFTSKKRISVSVTTNYVVSENINSKRESDNSINKQLIYVPMYSGNLGVSFTNKSFGIRYSQNYVSYRYTATDHSEYLLPYSLMDIAFFKSIILKKTKLELHIGANNLLNASYQAVISNAMPGRNFKVGVVIKL